MRGVLFFLLFSLGPAPFISGDHTSVVPPMWLIGTIQEKAKEFITSQESALLTELGFMVASVALFSGLYYLIALLGNKIIFLISTVRGRAMAWILAYLMAALPPLLPIYGVGKHGTIRWLSLPDLFDDLTLTDWGPYMLASSYGLILLAVFGWYLFKKLGWNENEENQP
jgi:hypothetical protein